MARKKGFDYFQAMEHLANNAKEASVVLKNIISDYELDNLHEQSEKIHTIERDGDEVVKEVMKELYVSFITPLDREDIVQIVDRLDDILDGINGVTYQFYHLNVTSMRADTDKFMELITHAVDWVQKAVKEFARFKNSKELMPLIDEVNRVESEGDRFYSEKLADLFRNEPNAIEVLKWKNVYDTFENILDRCEDAADIIAGLVIKNT
ncbi:DUF47 domain-containing protein [Enterococcus timonensis]|uniref:DUF47 domain-containing protein n=1 Tax=Enterococcus timonensis TaxID=1852364 RepID=UPI0008D9A842|nr:DUF47 family protein [Enterococcus timonensis]